MNGDSSIVVNESGIEDRDFAAGDRFDLFLHHLDLGEFVLPLARNGASTFNEINALSDDFLLRELDMKIIHVRKLRLALAKRKMKFENHEAPKADYTMQHASDLNENFQSNFTRSLTPTDPDIFPINHQISSTEVKNDCTFEFQTLLAGKGTRI